MTDVEITRAFVKRVIPKWTLRKEDDNTYTLLDSHFNEIAFFDENEETIEC